MTEKRRHLVLSDSIRGVGIGLRAMVELGCSVLGASRLVTSVWLVLSAARFEQTNLVTLITGVGRVGGYRNRQT